MNCMYCEDTRKYKMPRDKEKFDKIIDTEMEKGDFVSYYMAEEKAYKEVGYDLIDCPYCSQSK